MAAAVTTAAIGVGISGYMAYDSAQKKKDATRKLEGYDRQDLKNPYENIQISTIGSDLMREESGRTSANLVEAAMNSGSRGIFGAIPKIQAFTNLENRDAQKYLDDQVIRREYAKAGDETNLRAMREVRDNNNINALSSEIDSANQDMWNGISGAYTGMSSMMHEIEAGNKNKKGKIPKATAVNSLKPIGIQQSAKAVPVGSVPSIYPSDFGNFSAVPGLLDDYYNEDIINKWN